LEHDDQLHPRVNVERVVALLEYVQLASAQELPPVSMRPPLTMNRTK
jgi:hypothetical protein